MGIEEIKKQLEDNFLTASEEEFAAQLLSFSGDQRKGVQKLLHFWEKKRKEQLAEEERLSALLTYEKECYEKGFQFIAGIDEVGRGPLAGPVVAAAVILPKGCKIAGINDSKKVPEKKRKSLAKEIEEHALAIGYGVVSPTTIDEINILQATYEAMRIALEQLSQKPDYILADAVTIPHVDTPQKGIIKGDALSLSIGAASILAKVYRDTMMEELHKVYPQYGFDRNKGYGSREHLDAIQEFGLCPIHRRSFVKNILSPEQGGTNKQKGDNGERLAVVELGKMGYAILEKNYTRASGEIDIIAQKEDTIVFVEVKYRKSNDRGLPCEAVTEKKQQRIYQTALHYLAEQQLGDMNFRFDVAEVLLAEGKRYFRYTENAFWIG